MLTEKKRRHNLPISGMKHDITTGATVIKRIIRGYYESLYAHKFDNLDILDQVFEKPNY